MLVVEVTGYRNDGIGAAVALVNLGADDDLAGTLAGFNFLVTQLTPAAADRIRDWARALRPVFGADQEPAVALVNDLLARVPMRPHISDHGLGPHLHYSAPGADLADRVRANTAIGLAFVVCDRGADRLGVCAVDGCGRVFADLDRGPRRRYCSPTCLNRSRVAAYRARRAATPRP